MLLLYRYSERFPLAHQVLLPHHLGNSLWAYPCSQRPASSLFEGLHTPIVRFSRNRGSGFLAHCTTLETALTGPDQPRRNNPAIYLEEEWAMYLGVIYTLADGAFLLSGPNIQQPLGWRLQYARSPAALHAIAEELPRMESGLPIGHYLPALVANCRELATQTLALPDVDYRGIQGESAYWLHAFLGKVAIFEGPADLGGLYKRLERHRHVFMIPVPGYGFAICAWTTGVVPEARIFFSRSQGREIILGIPNHTAPEKRAAIRNIDTVYEIPEDVGHAAVCFSGEAALILTEALRRATGIFME